jgi:hypothetical protein
MKTLHNYFPIRVDAFIADYVLDGAEHEPGFSAVPVVTESGVAFGGGGTSALSGDDIEIWMSMTVGFCAGQARQLEQEDADVLIGEQELVVRFVSEVQAT